MTSVEGSNRKSSLIAAGVGLKLRAPSLIWRVAARLEAGDPGGCKRLAQACSEPAGAPTPDARELRQGA
jgi:hypothetical protein